MKREEFIEHLRTALMQLDDLQALRSNPLLPLLSPSEAANPLELQTFLYDGIEQVRRSANIRAERLFEILHYRYVEQFNQKDVAYQMDMSVRQLRREQNNAIELLADLLWKQLSLHRSAVQPWPLAEKPQAKTMLDQEMARLYEEYQSEASDLQAELAHALDNVRVLAERYGVQLRSALQVRVPQIAVPPLALRQALLSVFAAAIGAAPSRSINISMTQAKSRVHVTLQSDGQATEDGIMLVDQPAFQAAVRLLAPFDATLATGSIRHPLVMMALPTVESVPVLVVDDNPDICQLFQRYATNTRFRVVATDRCDTVMSLAQEIEAEIIVLDVMMPGDDGWDLIARLRNHPATNAIPIVICTVLPQQELAHLLGAAAFIQKPVEQTAFLKLLDQLSALGTRAPG